MFENLRLDHLGRVIYRIIRFAGYTEEWWFEYDSKGNKSLAKYIKEKKINGNHADSFCIKHKILNK